MVKADRFIPPRFKNLDIRNTKFQTNLKSDKYSKQLQKRLFSKNITNESILSYSKNALEPVRLRDIFSNNLYRKHKNKYRQIDSNPIKTLDTPALIHDYYLNLLDWSSTNVIAVALCESLYLWCANNGNIHKLTTFNDHISDYISSVSWIECGNYLAIGTSKREIEIWDTEVKKKVRTMKAHRERIGSLSWNQHLLTSGSKDGMIYNHDVRQKNHLVGTLKGHEQEICGLKWSPDGKYLASGGNDNLVHIWNVNSNKFLHKLTEHKAAVKGIDWCPWKQHLLATGAGSLDGNIKLWNTGIGKCLKSIKTNSQICAILWNNNNNNNKELITAHGYPRNCLVVWDLKNYQKITELRTPNNKRVLNMVKSPNGNVIASINEDDSLKFWKLNDKKKTKHEIEKIPFTKAIELR